MVVTERAAAIRGRILDAAEETFAHVGYYAASIRIITRRAGVELSLARYYFGNKDGLFRQVVLRRADAICRMLDESLAAAVVPAASPGLETVIDAMMRPAITCLASQDAGWRNYLCLLGGLGTLADRTDLLDPWRERYQPTVAKYHDALLLAVRREFPDAAGEAVDWALHFLQCLLGHGLLDIGVTRYVSGDRSRNIDWYALRRHLVWHVAGGLRAQCAGTLAGHEAWAPAGG